ncbi:unnamed protein product [[Candida] boidinii]|nr:unnamed protein product [[Candida] boidinii]
MNYILVLKFASINWDEFSIVETIEFTEIDDVAELPGPLNKSELEYRSLIQKQSTSLLEEAPPDFSESEPIEEVDHKEKEEEEEEQEYATNDQDLEDDDEVPGYDQGKINKPIQRSVPKGMNIKAAGVSRLQQQQQHQNKATTINLYQNLNLHSIYKFFYVILGTKMKKGSMN